MKTVPIHLKILSDVVTKEVVKKTVYSKLNAKINNLERKIPDASTLIQTNQFGDAEDKIPGISGLMTTAVLNKKIGAVKNKKPDTSCIATTSVLNTKN